MTESKKIFRGLTIFLGLAGLCISFAGMLLFVFLKNANFSVKLHIAIGVILILTGIISNHKLILYYFKSSHGLAFISSFILLLLSIYIIVCINYISFKNRVRYDFTKTNKYTLSDKTKNFLKTLKDPIQFIVNENIPENSLRDLNELINQFQFHYPKIIIRRYNPLKTPGLSANLQRDFALKPNHLLIVANEIKGTNIDKGPLIDSETERIPWHKGEQAILNAFLTTTSRKVNKLYFVQGHGETSFNETDIQKTNMLQLKNWLMTENFVLQDINLANQDGPIPDDCDVLVILNPISPFTPDEILKVDNYLSKENKQGNKGRLFFAVGANLTQNAKGGLQWLETNIETNLLKYGIIVDNKLLFEPESRIKSMGFLSLYIPPTSMLPHSITEPFIFNNLSLAWGDRSRSISPNAVPDKRLFFYPLLASSNKCKSLADINVFNTYKNKQLDDYLNEREGKAVAIAACVGELNTTDKKNSYSEDDVLKNGTKIVAVGNGVFLNSPIKETDRDFFINSIRWLTSEKELIGTGTNISQKITWVIPAEKEWLYREIIFYLMPLFWIFIGGLVWWVRKT